MTLSLAACGSKEESSEGKDSAEKKDGYTIGATYYTLETEFCMRMDNYAKKYCEEKGINYTSYSGNNDASTQLKQVETMITDGVDAIILNPQDADACAACVDAADEAWYSCIWCQHNG